MSELKIYTFCAYLSGDIWKSEPKPPQAYSHAVKFIQALKRETVNGWAEVPVPFGGATRRLEEKNKGDAPKWFAEIVAQRLKIVDPVRFVPVPSSKSTSRADVESSGTYEMAVEISKRYPGSSAAALLWWDEKMPSSRKENGPRDREILFPHLVTAKTAKKPACVLVDDVRTSCGHLLACEAALHGAGIGVVAAICAGRTVHDTAVPPFEMSKEAKERYRP